MKKRMLIKVDEFLSGLVKKKPNNGELEKSEGLPRLGEREKRVTQIWPCAKGCIEYSSSHRQTQCEEKFRSVAQEANFDAFESLFSSISGLCFSCL
ncbi:hypothetical protein AVEN_213755-1 [Araneus ventricosus]|uniref:Uncharacterized protein n=1 Tax=Araneus ventricosus TaxID=182803 RepID=A0A4Y2VQC6_ARAVE|nr:hypothetical protein AVEN_213755-1 [Araneus ventricosus]